MTPAGILRIIILPIVLVSLSRGAEDPRIPELVARADRGDSGARLELAIRYRDGRGVGRNPAEAMRWGHMAADQGDADAMDFIGFMYLRGIGVKCDADIAVGYFKAASAKSPQAVWNLGQCYFAAQGVVQDVPKALELWEKAADMGHGRSASVAAMTYLSGEGVAADPAKARRLAERAAELGDSSGGIVLGELCFRAGEIDRARALWTAVARVGPTRPNENPGQPSDEAAAPQAADLIRLIEYRLRKGEPGKFNIVPVPHILQGWNNCGATGCAMLARSQGRHVGGWDVKKLCPSPPGTGTDWGDLLDASEKIGLHWKLVTFPPDEPGFGAAAAFVRGELDAGRPVVIDFKYTGPQYPGGEAGHTLVLAGYIADGNLWVLCDPATPTPGYRIMSEADLKRYWRSDHYGRISNNVLSRPVIAISTP